MRFFELLNLQHVIAYVFPALLFMLVFWAALAGSHFHTRRSEARKAEITHRFPAGIEDRNAPFPLVMILIIGGTVAWMFFYILLHGLLGVKI